SSTHRDVHPTGPTMDEIRDKILDYGAKVKSVDPTALVVGPEEWGWSGYFYSGYDQQWGGAHGWSNLPDRTVHGNMDYLPWLLDQLRRTNNATGQRLLDRFTVHYYPQGGEFGNDVTTSMQLRRQPIDLRRHQRGGNRAESRQPFLIRGGPFLRQRADGDGHQQSVERNDAGGPQHYKLQRRRRGGTLAAHFGQLNHSSAGFE